ncbi:uncharacterized protein LY89DRAFT_672006 [Mollisia scopiformis]|uniref:MYND-type domain-containing protein n=1 Tax=Mollisia scopiformis TaxID=149040 RepID=A0A194X0J6_MOLSC|nr:uncharacterized protein LY89DRAFT_672006 [Mollisia scopiformis]KUJ13715.1 hypothetical protein LY89DRAFT_672006 [Mollisia scopiformis]
MSQIMEPIPLRTLITLLHYELMVSDPRYEGTALFQTSFADPAVIARIQKQFVSDAEKHPESIEKMVFHQFNEHKSSSKEPIPLTTCEIHPHANEMVKRLTPIEVEQIYLESRNHDGCFKAIGLFQFFFELCPAGQMISIQVGNEAPLIVNPKDRACTEFAIGGPKLITLASTMIPGQVKTYHTGARENEDHAVVVFNVKGPAETQVVVDMTRSQYGIAGRGTFGERYFLGNIEEWLTSMDKVCNNTTTLLTRSTNFPRTKSENENRIEACAKKVWERWQNRVKEQWCAYCGKPGVELKKCNGCKAKKICYCCGDHQKSDWKLHKMTCERKK